MRAARANRLRLLLLAVTLVANVSACGARTAARPSESLGAQLMDPVRREAAFCKVLQQGRYRGTPTYREEPAARCPIHHVVRAAQPDGTALYVVFRADAPEVYPEARPGVAKGPFTLVDEEGYLVPIFLNANDVDEHGTLFAHDERGRPAIAHQLPYTRSGFVWRVQVLHIVPVAVEQWPLLTLIVGPPFIGFMSGEKTFAWTWRARERQGLPADIELGPRDSNGGLARVAATYRYNVDHRGYVGPQGSAAEGFLRVAASRKSEVGACCPNWHDAASEWAYHFIRAPNTFDAPLLVEVEQPSAMHGRASDGTLDALWPTPTEARPALRLRTRGTCLLRTLTLSHGNWQVALKAPALRTTLPVEALQQMAAGDDIQYETTDACGGSARGSLKVP